MRKVWYHQILIQTYLGFIVLILTLVRSGKKDTRSDLNGDQEIKEQYFDIWIDF